MGVIIIAQASLLAVFVMYASQGTFYGYIFFHAVSFVVVMFLVANNENPSFKITWIIFIMLLPLIGGLLYVLFGNKRIPKKLRTITQKVKCQTRENMPPNTQCERLW